MEVPDNLFLEWETYPPVTEAELYDAERVLGYRLPETYRAVLRVQNGGLLRRCFYPTEKTTAWVSSFFGVGPHAGYHSGGLDREFSDGKTLNQQLIETWSYPQGIVICHQGHAGYILDYASCGPNGDPRVLYAMAECLPRVEITEVAPSFAVFLAGLTEFDQDGKSNWT